MIFFSFNKNMQRLSLRFSVQQERPSQGMWVNPPPQKKKEERKKKKWE